MATCLVVQHVAPESSFALGDALLRAGTDLDVRRVFDGAAVPDSAEGLDGLVVMGGPMSAASDDGFPTRTAEITLIADAVRRGVPTFGVCLGAQLLAVAGGAAVTPGGAGFEVGWAPVTLTAATADDPLFSGFPDELTVLHWHGETFGLPVGATHLAGNDRYRNQAFRLGPAAWGVQFHLEVTDEAVDGFVAAFADDASRAEGGAAAIVTGTPGAVAALAPWRDRVVERFATLVSTQYFSAVNSGK
jgi:GMP synthase-like glutamine amidotransferase